MRFESYRTTIRGLAALVLLGTTTALSHAEEPTHTRQPTQQQAKPATTASSKGQGQANVLDFEGDVIEGQKKTPEIFLQTEVERPTLDTVLYQRRHFNDYHKTDSRQRPRASDPPK